MAEASSGIEAVEAARQHKPDVAVVDVAMKELNGIEATSQILKHSPQTAVLILSMYSDERYVLRAVKAGARGYILKNSAGDELIQAIFQIQKGMAFFSPAVAQIFQNGYARLKDVSGINDRFELLTDRERQVYQLLAEGNSNKEIAKRLEPQPAHGGNAPLAHHGKARPAQHGGAGPERGAARDGDLECAVTANSVSDQIGHLGRGEARPLELLLRSSGPACAGRGPTGRRPW